MKIKSLQLKNFKRFTDLTLQDIPGHAKLVLLIGSNGSGKSSVFDAFEVVSEVIHQSQQSGKLITSLGSGKLTSYYYKNEILPEINIQFNQEDWIGCIFNTTNSCQVSSTGKFSANTFYGRSAVRYLPRITRTSIGRAIAIEKDSDRPQYYIDEDRRFENDIDLLIKDVVEKIFQGINTDNESQLNEVKKFLSEINDAFPRIFGTENGTNLFFKSFVPPADGQPSKLIFQKGESELNYDLLSSGEKEVVNLLFNLFVRKQYFSDTIYFFDEIDSHLNTKLQFQLIKEITENWIPDNCQLWTASHSLGFIQYATEYESGCIIDFNDFDFDKKQTLFPKSKNSFEIFEIAVSRSFIDQVMQGRKIIFSENTDTPFYNDLTIQNTFFFVAIDKNDVFHKAKNHKQSGIIDRDYLGDEEMDQLKTDYPHLYILPYYCFENLLYHPGNMEEYYKKTGKVFDKESYIQKINFVKNTEKDDIVARIIQARSGYPFYKETENVKKLKLFRENYKGVIKLLKSDDFETFYKVFSMKDYAKQLEERQNITPSDLAKTNWFKKQIGSILK